MFPIPFINYIPKAFRENTKLSTIQMCDEADDQLGSLYDEIINLKYLMDIERCPDKYLSFLGYLNNAGIINSDNETTKRQKIDIATASHKIRGSWENQVKIFMDAITGYSAEIFRATDSDDWILTGDGSLAIGSDWAILSGDGNEPYGMSLIGEGDEIEVAGNIYIDCHNGIHTAILSTAQITMLVNGIKDDVVPAYMRVYLGYIDSSGIFTRYSGGTIG